MKKREMEKYFGKDAISLYKKIKRLFHYFWVIKIIAYNQEAC